jgi:CRP/FNR family transcriptional regulator
VLTQLTIEDVRTAFPRLEPLETECLGELKKEAAEVHLPKGTLMFQPGDGCEGFGLVLGGSVRVSLESAGGRGLVLYRVRRGEICTVTASCVINDTPYPASGVVEEALTAVIVPNALFSRQIERSSVFRGFVLEIFSSRVGHLMELITQVAFNRLDQRLADRLLELGPVVRMSHQELAEELGTSREIVSRILESFSDEGAVSLGRRRIEIARDGLLTRRRG